MIDKKQDANKFVNRLLKELNVKNDAALSRALEVAPPVISKLRHGKLNIGDSMLVRVHELTELPIREIRTWAQA